LKGVGSFSVFDDRLKVYPPSANGRQLSLGHLALTWAWHGLAGEEQSAEAIPGVYLGFYLSTGQDPFEGTRVAVFRIVVFYLSKESRRGNADLKMVVSVLVGWK